MIEEVIPISLLKERIVEFFHEKGWDYVEFDGNMIYRDNKMGNIHYRMICSLGTTDEYLTMYLIPFLRIPVAYTTLGAEYICRVNYCLSLGHFDLHMESGSIRYRVTLEVRGGAPSLCLISHTIVAGELIFQKYFPGLLEMLSHNRKPAQVMVEVETG